MKYSSKRTALITTLVILPTLFVIGSLTLGWTGFRQEITFEAGNCKETYINEIADHPLKTLYYCEAGEYYDDETQSCGQPYFHHPENNKKIAQVDFLRCLCAQDNPSDYSGEIIENYEEARLFLVIQNWKDMGLLIAEDGSSSLKETTDPAVACEQLAQADWPINDY